MRPGNRGSANSVAANEVIRRSHAMMHERPERISAEAVEVRVFKHIFTATQRGMLEKWKLTVELPVRGTSQIRHSGPLCGSSHGIV